MKWTLLTVFGKWEVNSTGCNFVVDWEAGSKLYEVEEQIKYDEFVEKVCKAYNMVTEKKAVEISYVLPNYMQDEMPSDTPRVVISDDLQLSNFVTLAKTEVIRICVALKANRGGHNGSEIDKVRSGEEKNKRVAKEEVAVDSDCFGNVNYETMKPAQLAEAVCIKVGDIFNNKKELISKLRKLSVIESFDFNIQKSWKVFVANCFVPGCSWRIRASTISHSCPEFVVRIYIDRHTCSSAQRYSRDRQANAKCIGKMYVEGFSGGSDLRGIRPRHIADVMKAVHGIEIEYGKAHSALAYARELVRGTHASGYEDLPVYLYKIKTANPGTITKLECDDEGRFKYLFIAFGASIKGFEFLRRVVVVDGAHLSGKFRGVMLVAAGQDGDGRIFPIAFGIVNTENDASWEWFFTQLSGVIADDKNLAIVSDRYPSIANAVEKVFPAAVRGICLYHLGNNLAARFRKTPLVGLAKKAARLYREIEFDNLFEVIRRQDGELAKYLEDADFRLWALSKFPGDRYDIMTSNFAESINGALKEERSFPIAYFVDCIRKMMSRWFAERRDKAASLKTDLTPKVELMMHVGHANMNTLSVQPIDSNRSHVTGGEYFCTVDLEKRSCTCRQFDVEKIPCAHAIKAAESRKIGEATLVHPHFTKRYLCAAYAEAINPIDEDLIPPAGVLEQRCLPPPVCKQRGRPKMKRYLSAIEKAKRYKRHLLKKKNQATNQSNPVTTFRCRNPYSSTPPKKKKTKVPESSQSSYRASKKATKLPKSPPASSKKRKHSQSTPSTKMTEVTAPKTPAPAVRKRLFKGSPSSNPKKKRVYICTKCHKAGHNRSTCGVAKLLFG